MGNVSSGLGAVITSWEKYRFFGVEVACVSVDEHVAGKEVGEVEVVREPLDTPRMAGGIFLAARAEGSGTLGNICQSCASGSLSCKAGTMYDSCNRGLGEVSYNVHLSISKQRGSSQYCRSSGE